jgi:hypothetical protein
MTHHHHPCWRQDIAPLTLAIVGLLFLAGAAVVTFTTPSWFTETVPVGSRLEVTGTYHVPRPTSVLPAPNAVIGDVCSPAGATGASVAGPVVCRVIRVGELRWMLS